MSSQPRRLKAGEIKGYREELYVKQGGRCALTGYSIPLTDAVLDHCHKTGHVRGVIHRGVNSLLGKIENAHKMYGVSLPMVYAMGKGLEAYLTQDHTLHPLHSTHKTTEEKRIRRNTLARKRRAAAKAQP